MITVPRLLTLIGCSMSVACSTPQQTAALECGVGAAAVSFALCRLVGGNTGACAGIGAGVGAGGGAACYGLADHLEKDREVLAGKENDLTARLQYVQRVNADSEKYLAQLQKSLQDTRQQTDDIVAGTEQNRYSAKQIADAKAAINKQSADAQRETDATARAYADMKQYQARHPHQSSQLDARTADLLRLRDAMQRDTTALASQSQRI